MFRTLREIVTFVVWVAMTGIASAQDVETPARPIPGQYIVVLDEDRVIRAAVKGEAEAIAKAHGGSLLHIYEDALRGFTARMSPAAAAALSRNPNVRYIEQDSVMEVVETQPGATWGLDRIDQHDLPLGGTYTYNTPAMNVSVYIIDTGIRSTHTEFSGRVSATGYTAIGDGNGTNDCNGHGTHVAGTVGGNVYGVAKGVTLHAVRVLGCSGSGSTSGVIAGVNWVTANRVVPAVANMSLGGGASTALDDAVRNSVAAGVTYAIAAGNSNTNACNSSPARVSQALTVGSSTSTDARSSFSNYGTCVDVFAPGSSIRAAWPSNDSTTNVLSGTSMASPHVAGAAALYLSENPLALPAAVHAAIADNATVNRLSNVGAGSPNRLLYSVFGSSGPVDAPPVANFTFVCSGLTCTFNGTSSTDDHGINSHAWDFGDGQTGSGSVIEHAYSSAGTFTARLTVTDTAGQGNTESQSVTVSGGGGSGPCTNCEEYAGTLSGTGDTDLHPNGAAYTSVAGTHRGWLQGPSGANFNLHLQRWNGSQWATVSRSVGLTSEEQVTYSGTAGDYRWLISSAAGSGSYGFWLQRP